MAHVLAYRSPKFLFAESFGEFFLALFGTEQILANLGTRS